MCESTYLLHYYNFIIDFILNFDIQNDFHLQQQQQNWR